MIERLSHEPASALAEDDGRSDRLQTFEVLRAQLSRTISEGLGQGSVAGEWGEIDNAQIAAFLDCSLSRAEWDAVATRLANDPVARAELAAAAALLDEIQAQPATAPAGLMERAAGVLARSEQNHQRVSAAAVTPVARYRRSIAWSGFALAVLAMSGPGHRCLCGNAQSVRCAAGAGGGGVRRHAVGGDRQAAR